MGIFSAFPRSQWVWKGQKIIGKFAENPWEKKKKQGKEGQGTWVPHYTELDLNPKQSPLQVQTSFRRETNQFCNSVGYNGTNQDSEPPSNFKGDFWRQESLQHMQV